MLPPRFGRHTGLIPLALRSLRDLLRDVPIGPGFIYGDVARGVMRLALTRSPGERARATIIAATLEEIIARQIRRKKVLLHRLFQAKIRFLANDRACLCFVNLQRLP